MNTLAMFPFVQIFEACRQATMFEKAGYQHVTLEIKDWVIHIYGFKVPAKGKKRCYTRRAR